MENYQLYEKIFKGLDRNGIETIYIVEYCGKSAFTTTVLQFLKGISSIAVYLIAPGYYEGTI